MNAKDFEERLGSLAPGEAFCYYVGDLASDRYYARRKGDTTAEMLGRAAYAAYAEGRAHLSQRKWRSYSDEINYAYIATKRSKPHADTLTG